MGKNRMQVLRKKIRLILGRARPVPVCIFCYHKSGTVLLTKVFRQICKVKQWNFKVLMGKQEKIPFEADVVLFGHSLIDMSQIKMPFIGVHIIRDPRDIIISGYLYHQRTQEKWCINKDFSIKPPILFPKVPYSQQHRSEEWKINYLKSLGGISYQENLLNLPQADGLLFEMRNYGAWTIDSMRNWDYKISNVLEIKFEEIMKEYDNSFDRIFNHIGISKADLDICMNLASRHDLQRKSEKEIKLDKHISSKKYSKWRKYFEPQHKKDFVNRFGNVLVELGYEVNNDW